MSTGIGSKTTNLPQVFDSDLTGNLTQFMPSILRLYLYLETGNDSPEYDSLNMIQNMKYAN